MTQNVCSLEGKLILVTGAGTGIGRGVALELARQGADVAISYCSSAEGAAEVVAEIKGMGRRSTALQADMGKVSECCRVVDQAAEFLGGLDGLFNNAGVTLTLDFQDVTKEAFNRLYNVNVRGQFFTCQQAVPHMIARGKELRHRFPERPWAGGSMVNMSSAHGSAVGGSLLARPLPPAANTLPLRAVAPCLPVTLTFHFCSHRPRPRLSQLSPLPLLPYPGPTLRRISELLLSCPEIVAPHKPQNWLKNSLNPCLPLPLHLLYCQTTTSAHNCCAIPDPSL